MLVHRADRLLAAVHASQVGAHQAQEIGGGIRRVGVVVDDDDAIPGERPARVGHPFAGCRRRERRCALHQTQAHLEFAASAGSSAATLDSAAVQLDQLLDEGRPDAEAAPRSRVASSPCVNRSKTCGNRSAAMPTPASRTMTIEWPASHSLISSIRPPASVYFDALSRSQTRWYSAPSRIVDVSRDQIKLKREVTDLRAVLQAAVEAIGPTAESAWVRLEVRLHRDPVPVEGDAMRLGQVFGNRHCRVQAFSSASASRA